MRQRDAIWIRPVDAARAEITAVYATARDAVRAAGESRPALASIFATIHDHAPDCADKFWRGASFAASINPAKALRIKAKALGLNPEQRDLDIALSGMVPWHDGESWLIAVAVPAPRPMTWPQAPVTDIVIIDPATCLFRLYGDSSPRLVLSADERRFTVMADAMTWAREFATARLEWLYSARDAKRLANIEPVWTGLPSSALAIGDVRKVQWPMAEVITAGAGIDAKSLTAAVRRQFHLPRIHTSDFRAAA